MNCLGILYEKGLGVKLDKKKAERLYRMAADRGDAVGQAGCALAPRAVVLGLGVVVAAFYRADLRGLDSGVLERARLAQEDDAAEAGMENDMNAMPSRTPLEVG
ncbi:hypothetical protein JL721_7539 [Aureococcus anophagefferens]|nr:hypothetical protein JL721_7539 [Aureococcus anophagefferens]